MRHEAARRLISASLDQVLGEGRLETLEAHLAGCGDCRRFRQSLLDLRARLAVPGGEPFGLVARVMAALPGRRPKLRPAPLVAGFAAGAVMGVVLVAGLVPGRVGASVFAAEFSERLAAAQRQVDAFTASVSVVERGWHQEVPVRNYRGRLSYRAPETLALVLDDHSEYPSAEWVPNEVSWVAEPGLWWSYGLRPCSSFLLPTCSGVEPTAIIVEGREPFPRDRPLPLDLVVPVDSFAFTSGPEVVAVDQRAGRPAALVRLGFAQASPLIEGWLAAGNWRPFHPTDQVELWLDTLTLLPLEIRVLAADDPFRQRWGVSAGHPDMPGTAILEIRLEEVEFDADRVRFSPARPGVAVVGEFVEGPPAIVLSPPLPAGMEPYRAGVSRGGVSVASFTDGRSWLKVSATEAWSGRRLFGDLGTLVREVNAGAAGVLFVAEDGRQVGMHAAGLDLVVEGSLPTDKLAEIAAGLGEVGLPLPSHWAEAATATIEEAQRALPGLLIPAAVDGYGPPSVRVAGEVVSIRAAGSGRLGYLLVQRPGETLAPPFDPGTVGISVRGLQGRFTPALGEISWVEDGLVVALRSRALNLSDLIDLAEGLR